MTDQTSTADRVERMLANAADTFGPFASRAVLEAEEAVQEIIQVYPPQPSRTRARRFNTYVRGQGQYPRSAFVADKNEPGGYKTKRTPKGKIRFTSQQLDKRWKKEVRKTESGAEGELKNTASYSGAVNGWEQDEEGGQRDYHQATGWVSSDQSINQAAPRIQEIGNQVAKAFIRKLNSK